MPSLEISKYTFKTNINDNLNVPINNFILTPSPSDVNMIVSPSNSTNDILLELNSINQNISEPDFVSGSRAVLIKSPEIDVYENTETFQSRAEIKFGSDKHEETQNEKNQKSQSKVQYPGQAVQVITEKNSGSPKTKKVGFFEAGKTDFEISNYDICETPNDWARSPKKVVASVKQTPEIQKVSYDQNKSQVKTKKLERSPKKKMIDVSDTCSDDSKTEIMITGGCNQKLTKKPPKRCSKTPDLRKVSKMESEGDDKSSKSRNILKRSNSDAIMSRRNENGEAVSVKIQFTKDGVKVISDKESIV